MALPPIIQTVTVTMGPMLDFQGNPLKGLTTFEPSTALLAVDTGTPILNRAITVEWNSDGMATVVLPATDTTGINVTNFTYRVSHRTHDSGVPAPVGGNISLPAAAPVVDLDLLVPTTASNGVVVAQPEVISVAGLSGVVAAADLAGALDGLVGGVADGSVTTSKLATGAVATSKLATGAVTAAKLGSDVPAAIADDPALRAAFGTSSAPAVLASTAGLQARGENGAAALTIPTPASYSTDEAVHPSVVHVPGGFGGYTYWMAFTPYPGGAQFYENPCIVASHDGYAWEVPPGLTNPVEPRPTGSGSDFNSDVFLLHHAGKLWLFFRQVENSFTNAEDRLYYRTSTDGVTWAPKVLVMANKGTVRKLVSPSYQVRDGRWQMWAVDVAQPPNVIVRYTAADPAGPWTGPQTVTGYTTTNGTWQPWHLDVHAIGDEYVMLMHETDTGQGKIGNLRRAVSQDGLVFNPDPALVMTGIVGSWDNGLYRAGIVPTRIDGQDGYRMWYSALSGTWHIGHALVRLEPRERSVADLLAATIPVSPGIAGDVQNRADNAAVPGVLTSGQTWQTVNGTWGVVSRAIQASSGGYLALNLGRADVEVGWTIAAVPDAAKQMYVIVGWDGTSNGDHLRWGPNGPTGYTLHGKIAGAFFSTITNQSFVPQVGDRVKVRIKKGEAKFYVNDMLLQRYSAPSLAANTYTGLYTNSVSIAAMRNFYAKAI